MHSNVNSNVKLPTPQQVCIGCDINGTCKRKRTLTSNYCQCKPRLMPMITIPQFSIRQMQREEHLLRNSAIEYGD